MLTHPVCHATAVKSSPAFLPSKLPLFYLLQMEMTSMSSIIHKCLLTVFYNIISLNVVEMRLLAGYVMVTEWSKALSQIQVERLPWVPGLIIKSIFHL